MDVDKASRPDVNNILVDDVGTKDGGHWSFCVPAPVATVAFACTKDRCRGKSKTNKLALCWLYFL